MRISDWSSDVCSSDLDEHPGQVGVGPEDIDIAQLQDTEAGAEIMHMAENGFCADGEQAAWIAEGRTRIDGRLPVNTDGGRSEERRVGKECVSTGSTRGYAYH